MSDAKWVDLGPVAALKDRPVRALTIDRTRIALTFKDGKFGAISGICNHVGGPLGDGTSPAITSSAPGTAGSSIARPEKGSRASRPTRCPLTRSKSAMGTCS